MFFKYTLRNWLMGVVSPLFDFAESVKLISHSYGWRKNGFVVPLPNLLKRSIILREALAHQANTLVETGTFLGDTPWFLRKKIAKIYTIEVHQPLADLAKRRFRSWSNIEVLNGDSGTQLALVVPKLKGNVLFWLDGHYSEGITGKSFEDCPVIREFDAITQHCSANWLILIDDARDFGSDPAYPTTDQLKAYFTAKGLKVELTVANDIIKIQRLT
jgi:hypothetical protein